MKTAIVTGSGGLVGNEACEFLDRQGFNVVGIDNDMRTYFFLGDASTSWNARKFQNHYSNFSFKCDVRKTLSEMIPVTEAK